MTGNIDTDLPVQSIIAFHAVSLAIKAYFQFMRLTGHDEHAVSELHVKRLPWLLESFADGSTLDLKHPPPLRGGEKPQLLVFYRYVRVCLWGDINLPSRNDRVTRFENIQTVIRDSWANAGYKVREIFLDQSRCVGHVRADHLKTHRHAAHFIRHPDIYRSEVNALVDSAVAYWSSSFDQAKL
jgi:hypothetical protein